MRQRPGPRCPPRGWGRSGERTTAVEGGPLSGCCPPSCKQAWVRPRGQRVTLDQPLHLHSLRLPVCKVGADTTALSLHKGWSRGPEAPAGQVCGSERQLPLPPGPLGHAGIIRLLCASVYLLRMALGPAASLEEVWQRPGGWRAACGRFIITKTQNQVRGRRGECRWKEEDPGAGVEGGGHAPSHCTNPLGPQPRGSGRPPATCRLKAVPLW